jgi:mitochondrial translocator assembly and maintenance protein 41
VQEQFGAQLYYHTDVEVCGRRLKYGVITRRHLLDDLLHWRHLYAAGRLHKPTAQQYFGARSVHSSQVELRSALLSNRRAALATALLCQPARFDHLSLFRTIVQLSYTGVCMCVSARVCVCVCVCRHA